VAGVQSEHDASLAAFQLYFMIYVIVVCYLANKYDNDDDSLLGVVPVTFPKVKCVLGLRLLCF